MMGINSAGFAEIMLGRFGAPLIKGQVVNAFDNSYAVNWRRYRNCTPPRAKTAVTSASFSSPSAKVISNSTARQ
jgi:hypothetical protein